MIRKLITKASKIIDSLDELAHAASACVELAREATTIRFENIEVVKKDLKELRDAYDTVDSNLAATEVEVDELKKAAAYAENECKASREELTRVVNSRGDILAELGWTKPEPPEKGEIKRLADELIIENIALKNARSAANEFAAKLEWLQRWRKQSDVKCPFGERFNVDYGVADFKNNSVKTAQYIGKCPPIGLDTSDYWRPTVECLEYWEEFKDV